MKYEYRPRANSAPSVAALSTRAEGHVHYPHILNNPKYHHVLSNGNSRNVLNGFTVTHVPLGQPMTMSHLSVVGARRHKQRRSTLSNALSISQEQMENIELRCCRINVLLVTMELCLGAIVTALAFYMQTLTSSLRIRECPYWAGIPLLVTGVVGIYFCATEFATYSSTKAFVIKCVCFTLSASCVFLCMMASVFPGFLGSKIAKLVNCNMTDTKCVCAGAENPEERIYMYEDIDSCETLIASVKDYLILQCSLNCIASGVCFWFVTLLWKSRYQDEFQPGLKIYSCNGNIPSLYLENHLKLRTEDPIYPPPSPLIGVHTYEKRHAIHSVIDMKITEF